MPVKKTTTSKSVSAAKPKPAAKPSVPQHDHAALQAEIAELRKEVAALKGQCHSCCADLAELKSSGQASVLDPRLDELLNHLRKSIKYNQLRGAYKRQK